MSKQIRAERISQGSRCFALVWPKESRELQLLGDEAHCGGVV